MLGLSTLGGPMLDAEIARIMIHFVTGATKDPAVHTAGSKMIALSPFWQS
jgi:hypothetical protein